tara:strand:+ start:367 stop:735 length:369 start_codon:yes stop_codon:yes gene_type:complete
MTSTRNKNTPGNYLLEEQQFRKINNHIKFLHSSNGPPHNLAISSGGTAPPSRMNSNSLSENAIDIESSLLGIGSTNLVTPLPKITPRLNHLPTVSFFVRPPLIMPPPLEIDGYQRPFPNINS